MRKFQYLIYSILIYYTQSSCTGNTNSNPDTFTPPAENYQNHDSTKRALDAAHDAELKKIEDQKKIPKKYVSVKPKGTFKTYPQIVRTLFGRGSTEAEVLSIMGRPELIEKGTESSETWFYGRIEIYFQYTHVYDGYNLDECESYADLEELLLSDDPIEKRFGLTLLGRH